eukprot:TRINITY_DN1088_c0_g2_i1.p1 TRINITY_DN1088_c0_g2~~TRINITY_DN1088_c0_g2_i1.p1  ORF type:complete len:454 (-),score=81.66 TRINITY_DN1088_c0_g2_i1:63-1424(-)
MMDHKLMLIILLLNAYLIYSNDMETSSTKFAYTSIFYTGTPKDNEYFQGLRVMFETVKRTGTEFDRVALLSQEIPSWMKDRLHKDGIKTNKLDNVENPFKNKVIMNENDPNSKKQVYHKRFEHVLNKLSAWKLTQYKRVAMLDSDLLFLNNADNVFACGEFCALFINPCIFHTGLIVLEPSQRVFDDMMYTLEHNATSVDGADLGFLNYYYSGLLNSPLYVPKSGGLDANPLKPGISRLSFGYHLDHSYYYQIFRWDVPCSDKLYVIGFPSLVQFKPWYWWSWPFFILSLDWHHVCTTMEECHTPLLHQYSLLIVILLNTLAYFLYQKLKTYKLPVYIPSCVKLISIMVLAIIIPFHLIPPVNHPHSAWPIYFSLVSVFGSVLCALSNFPPTRLLILLVYCFFSVFLIGANIYANYIYKIITLVVLQIFIIVFITSTFLIHLNIDKESFKKVF